MPDLRALVPGKRHVPLCRSQLCSNRPICGPVHHGSRRAAAAATAALYASTRARGPAAAVRSCVDDPRARSAGSVRSSAHAHAHAHDGAIKAQDRAARPAAPRQVPDGPPTVPRRPRRRQGRAPAPALVRAERIVGGPPLALPRVDADAADPRPADPDVHHVPRDGASGAPRRPRGQRGRFRRPRRRRRVVAAAAGAAWEKAAQEGSVPRVLLLQRS